ncbi:Sau3AI family type II restriction endonuclease [Bifidobacterium parmae]|uniref:DNA mismatch repair protein MutH n=1 Tax=Bifidobacterium parmae TaxID=361854 RepID=A0A2N5J4T6_9BIFI|nr:Sau3AI family type II restriction endonuclease [Bifidobacterium parmae]PLS29218.1 DNA mismatch repair protein MutH [Bifidobacterium parmae]
MSDAALDFNETREYSSLDEVMTSLLSAKDKTFRELDKTGRALKGGNKGSLGQIIEESVLGYAINSDAEPDIRIGDTSYELKVTPLKHIKKGKETSAKERLVIDIINYMALADETDFESSKMWDKAKNVILVYYYDDRIDKQQELRIDCKVLASYLLRYQTNDLETIKEDWETIRAKVASGHADQLSESDTNYLAACTKGANSKQLRDAPAPEGAGTPIIRAKQRAFSFKTSYMTAIARQLLSQPSELQQLPLTEHQSLNGYLQDRFAPYIGKTAGDIAAELGLSIKPTANQYNASIARAMLSIKKSDILKTEEFYKANVSMVKTVTMYPNGLPKENMSFKALTDARWQQWADPDVGWDDSFLKEFFETNRLLIAVSQSPVPHRTGHDKSKDVFRGGFLWNMPAEDVEQYIKPVWEYVHELLVHKTWLDYGVRGKNKLPGQSFNEVFHLRPHTRRGRDSGQSSDITVLPSGEVITKQSFWLDRRYIAKSIKAHNLLV